MSKLLNEPIITYQSRPNVLAAFILSAEVGFLGLPAALTDGEVRLYYSGNI